MAKGARASKVKSNRSKLKSKVFGPIERARTERLSAKLLELASQSLPSRKAGEGVVMGAEIVGAEDSASVPVTEKESNEMEIDQAIIKTSARAKTNRGRIQKKKSYRSKASIIFPKYKDRTGWKK